MAAENIDPLTTVAELYPRLMRAMGHLRGLVDEGMDLTYNQYKALLSISGMGPCTLNALGKELGVAASSTSQMVDRLVSMELVSRTAAEGDRRQVVLRTTPEGEGLIEKVKDGIVARYREVFRQLGPAEQASLAGAIHTLVRILERVSQNNVKD